MQVQGQPDRQPPLAAPHTHSVAVSSSDGSLPMIKRCPLPLACTGLWAPGGGTLPSPSAFASGAASFARCKAGAARDSELAGEAEGWKGENDLLCAAPGPAHSSLATPSALGL